MNDLTGPIFPPDRGGMIAAVRDKDWSLTPLGPIASWPDCLRTAAGICLHSQFPMVIFWGRELIFIYNDAYIPMLGHKHPDALGRRGGEVWSEVWPQVREQFDRVMKTGSASLGNDVFLALERRGFVEECYFTYSHSPIFDACGSVAGVFTAVLETTERVLAERRSRTLSGLAGAASILNGQDDAFSRISEVLARNPYDLPFCMLYLVDANAARLTFACGLEAGMRQPDPELSLQPDAGSDHPIAQAARTSQAAIHDAGMLFGPRQGIWPRQANRMLVLPLRLTSEGLPRAVLAVGINPRRPLDQAYREFFDLVCGHIASAITNAEWKKAGQVLLLAHAQLESRFAERARKLHEANEMLTAVFDRAPDGIVVADINGNFIRANAAYQKLLGFTEQQLLGQTLQRLTHPEDYPEKQALLQQLLERKRETFELEMRYLLPDGRVIWVSNHVSVLDDETGKPRYFVKIVQDISARKRAEQEILSSQKALAMLYDRLQTVREEERMALAREVHDLLGQLLSAAKIDIKLLEEDIRPRDVSLSRRKIAAGLRSARTTIEKAIESVRRISTELRSPELEEQGLAKAIEWHARDFERRTRIKCMVSIAADMREPDARSAIALFRIFQEAMTNVLRHAKASEVRIHLGRRGAQALLRVLDNGVGIAPVRIRSARSIGLKGMRERAEMAGGKLIVAPLRRHGTLVSARVPLADRFPNHDTAGPGPAIFTGDTA